MAFGVSLRPIRITHHAQQRLHARRLPGDALAVALLYGRPVRTRGATIYALGRKQLAAGAREGLDLRAYHGIQVVTTAEGVVLTAYRNHDLRGLRPRRHSRRP